VRVKDFVVYDNDGDWLNDYDTLEEAEKFCEAFANNTPHIPLYVFRKCAVVTPVTTVKVSYYE
jgi:hypothetical protein